MRTPLIIALLSVFLFGAQSYASVDVPVDVQVAAFNFALDDSARRGELPVLVELSVDGSTPATEALQAIRMRLPHHNVRPGRCKNTNERCASLRLEIASASEHEFTLRPWVQIDSSGSWCEYRFTFNGAQWQAEKGETCGGSIACGRSAEQP